MSTLRRRHKSTRFLRWSGGEGRRTIKGASCVAVAIAGLTPSLAAIAGQVYGTIRGASNAVVANEVVRVYCGADDSMPVAVTRTGEFGEYSVYVPETGTCRIKVGASETVGIPIYDGDVKHDLRLDGSSLRRD